MNQETAEKPTKVLYVITKATSGGAQRYVYDLVSRLPHEFRSAVVYGETGRLSAELEASGFQTMHIPELARDLSILSDIRSYFGIRNTIRASAPDVLHLNSSKAAGLGAIAGRLAGVPRIIYTVHGWPFKEDRSYTIRFLIYLMSWFTALLSHAVIVVSKHDETSAKRMWWVRKKVFYIPLARAELQFLAPHDAYKKMFAPLSSPTIGPDTVRIVTIAELTRNKGIRYALRAVKHLVERGIDCIYVIPGEGEELGTLKDLALSFGISDRVFFPGFVEDASVYLKGFDVFVLPSIKEGTPYVLLEAALAGLPIVATEAVDADLAAEIPHLTRVPIKNALSLADAIAGSARTLQQTETPRPRSLEHMVRQTADLYRA